MTLEIELTPDHQVAFVHVPKTAGTSLQAVLAPQFDPALTSPYYYINDLLTVKKETLNRYHYFPGHIPYQVMKLMLARRPIFLTMLREPIDRFMSHFYFYKRHPQAIPVNNHPPEHIASFHNLTLTEFVEVGNHSVLNGMRNLQAKFFVQNLQISTLSKWQQLYKKSVAHQQHGRHRPSPLDMSLLNSLADFTLVGLTEQYQAALFLLAFIFGWRPIRQPQRLNVSENRPQPADIKAETRAQIAALNEAEMALYAQGKTLFNDAYQTMTTNLLRRYGQAKHAHQPLPLPADMMIELLEKHYAQRLSARLQPVPELIFSFTHPLTGSGWHALEGEGNQSYRWSGPDNVATLDLPLVAGMEVVALPAKKAKTWRLELTLVAAITPDILTGWTLSVNDVQIPLTPPPNSPAGELHYQGIIPATAVSGHNFLRLTFHTPETVAPTTLSASNQDQRHLGIALRQIKIYPTQENQ